MSGQISPKPRWKRVQSSVDSQVGEILGKSYVDKYSSGALYGRGGNAIWRTGYMADSGFFG